MSPQVQPASNCHALTAWNCIITGVWQVLLDATADWAVAVSYIVATKAGSKGFGRADACHAAVDDNPNPVTEHLSFLHAMRGQHHCLALLLIQYDLP